MMFWVEKYMVAMHFSRPEVIKNALPVHLQCLQNSYVNTVYQKITVAKAFFNEIRATSGLHANRKSLFLATKCAMRKLKLFWVQKYMVARDFSQPEVQKYMHFRFTSGFTKTLSLSWIQKYMVARCFSVKYKWLLGTIMQQKGDFRLTIFKVITFKTLCLHIK